MANDLQTTAINNAVTDAAQSRLPVGGYMVAITTTPDATAVLEAQIVGLREVSDLLRHQLDDLREDRDRWRAQAESARRQLTSHDSRSWWRRLVGS